MSSRYFPHQLVLTRIVPHAQATQVINKVIRVPGWTLHGLAHVGNKTILAFVGTGEGTAFARSLLEAVDTVADLIKTLSSCLPVGYLFDLNKQGMLVVERPTGRFRDMVAALDASDVSAEALVDLVERAWSDHEACLDVGPQQFKTLKVA